MKRRPLRAVSDKNEALMAEFAPIRREAREEYGRCMICECSPLNPDRELLLTMSQLAIHEIACGKYRMTAYPHRFCWLVLCWYCNTYVVTNKGDWPVERQLCLQKIRVPEWHDREAFVNLIRPQAPNWITEADVDAYRDELLSEIVRGSL